MSLLKSCILLVVLCILEQALSLQCLNNLSEPVPWWLIYKFPSVPQNRYSLSGEGYAYFDSASSEFKILSPPSINDPKSPLSITLNMFYASQSANYFLWNDEPPSNSEVFASSNSNISKAFSKAVLAFDENRGFFLRHSVEKFPEAHAQSFKGIPLESLEFGHYFLCLTLDLNGISTMAGQNLISYPNIYAQKVSPDLASKYPNISLLEQGKIILEYYDIAGVSSIDSSQFWFDIAKSPYFQSDLWGLVAVRNPPGINVLAWAPDKLPDECLSWLFVQNILSVSWKSFSLSYTSDKDMAKWAVHPQRPIVCFGDQARSPQFTQRGGGASCLFFNNQIWTYFKNLVEIIQTCPPTPPTPFR